MRFSLILLSALTALPAHAATGRLGLLSGDVLVNQKKAAEGQEIRTGDFIDTQSGKCALLMPGKGVAHLAPGTKLKVSESEGVPQVNMLQGKTRVLISGAEKTQGASKFRIRTTSATMGVRGTEVYVSQPPGDAPAQFVTVEGVADVQTPTGPVSLGANQSVQTGSGAPASVQTLAPGAAEKLAYSVAPPAAEIQTESQAANAESGADSISLEDADSMETVDMSDLFEFDPLADGGQPMTISISVTRQ
jgi:hypothetical protein